MKPLTEKTITAGDILEGYEMYDIGEQPYRIVKLPCGEVELENEDLLKAYENKTQQQTNNEVRQLVLDMVQQGNTEELERLVDEFVQGLIYDKEDFDNVSPKVIRFGFMINKMKFLLFFLDLPKPIAKNFAERLFDSEKTRGSEREFMDLVDPKAFRIEVNSFSKVFLHYVVSICV